ncbi:MAG: TIGR00374 family protein [Verrucomicrobia bacterium]|nr:MAG: TIGR00374 family protein [Verrucomicrobiota bacterium]
MKTPRKLRLTAYFLGLVGAALFTALLVRQGVMSVGAAVATAGWGIAAVAAFHLLPILLDALAWQVLFPPGDRPRWQSLFWMRWIGESISNLVPSATVGGDIVRARLVAINGVPLSIAAASIIVDITLGIVTQIVFTLLGLALVINVTGRTSFVGPTLVGTLIGVAAVAGFYFAQRRGMFRFVSVIITRLVNSPEWSSLVEGGATLDQTVRALYGRRRGVLACCAWTMVSLLASSGEIWIALHALGLPASLVNALILQSMAMTIRSVAFPVPGALGVQEGGYLVVGNLLGIPGEAAFAISLITRFRDLTVGLPGLVTWQLLEWHRFWRARSVLASR